MSAIAVFAEALVIMLQQHPDVAVLSFMSVGAYYELHHGRIAEMAKNQRILGVAVYKLMEKDPTINAEEFREDMWGEEDMGGYHPGDWEAEPSDGTKPRP